MFYVYILYSQSIDRYYVGQTDNIELRLKTHLSGASRYTAVATDWQVAYKESYSTRSKAIKRELAIKRKKSRKYIEWLVENGM